MNVDCLREISFHIHHEDFANWMCVSKAMKEAVYMKEDLFNTKYAEKWGLLHGPNQMWEKRTREGDSYLVVEENYDHRGREGTWTLFYEDGTVKKQITYEDDEKHGKHMEWDRTGRLRFEADFKNGEKDGVFRKWDHNGVLFVETHYRRGREHGTKKTWTSIGDLEKEETYCKGARHGRCKTFLGDSLVKEMTYKKGLKHGLERTWTVDDRLKTEAIYIDNYELASRAFSIHGVIISQRESIIIEGSPGTEEDWFQIKSRETKRFKREDTPRY